MQCSLWIVVHVLFTTTILKGYSANFYFLWKNFLHFRVWNANSKMLEVLELNLLIILNIFKCQIIDHYMKIMHYEAFIRNHKPAKNRNLLNNPLLNLRFPIFCGNMTVPWELACGLLLFSKIRNLSSTLIIIKVKFIHYRLGMLLLCHAHQQIQFYGFMWNLYCWWPVCII